MVHDCFYVCFPLDDPVVAEFLRRGSKFIYWLLLLAAVLAVILIFVVVYRSSQ